MLVVDLTHWLLPNGELAPAAKLGPYIARIVECVTAVEGASVTAMACRRKRCAGTLVVQRHQQRIDWACCRCDEAGTVSGWAGTRWDLSAVPIGPEGDELAAFMPVDELAALRELEGLSPVVRAALAGAPLVEDRACVTLTAEEVGQVLTALDQARRRQLWDRARGRLDQLLVSYQWQQQPSARALH